MSLSIVSMQQVLFYGTLPPWLSRKKYVLFFLLRFYKKISIGTELIHQPHGGWQEIILQVLASFQSPASGDKIQWLFSYKSFKNLGRRSVKKTFSSKLLFINTKWPHFKITTSCGCEFQTSLFQLCKVKAEVSLIQTAHTKYSADSFSVCPYRDNDPKDKSGMVSLADPFFLFKNSGFLVAFFFNMQSPLNHLCSGLAPGVFGFFCAFWYFGDWHRLSPQASPSRVHMCSLDFAREVGFIFFCLLHDIGRDNSPSNLKKNLFP